MDSAWYDAWKEQELASPLAAQEDPAVLSSLEWDLKSYICGDK